MFEGAHHAFVSIDERGQVTYWNARAEKIFGYGRDQVLGMLLADTIVPERFRARHVEGLRSFLETGTWEILDRPIERVAQRRDGSELPVRLSVTATPADDGWRFHALIEDLTERQGLLDQLAAVMRGRQPDFAQILDVLADAVTIRDRADHIIYANRAALDTMGFATLAELQSRPLASIMGDYLVLDEFGRELSMADIPSVKLMRDGRADPLLMRTVQRSSGELTWQLLKATALTGEDGELVATVMIIEDVTEPKNAELRHRFLAEASEMLVSSLDYAQTLQNIAWSVVPQLADWCAVDLVDESGTREHVVVAHSDPERLELAQRLREYEPRELDPEQGMGKVLQTGRSELFSDISDSMLVQAAQDEEHLALLRGVAMRSVLLVPLRTPLRTLGVMTLVMSESQRTFNWQDLEFVEQLAARAAMAVENALLYRARVQIAETLQRNLLPEHLPAIPGWDVATLYRPAGAEREIEVGGDFYDFVELDDGWLVIIGDVTGKGLAAAALTLLVRHCARFMCRIDPRPSAVLAAIDEALVEHGSLSLCTALCLRLQADEIVFCAGGHPLPLVVKPGGEIREVGQAGILLGLPNSPGWQDERFVLGEDETLVIYTDGVTDARGADGRFGIERLCELVRAYAGSPPTVLLAALDGALARFRLGPQADDTAAVALARTLVKSSPTRMPPAARPRSSAC
ncbi:MAG TPA: SpoIIE family protein phosphatase [Solirubrobacteraceae bacterium]|jgi:PAS domain S-box-containing protein